MDKVPNIQEKIYKEILILTKDLKLDNRGNIKNLGNKICIYLKT
jgi:hypothetical protein